MKQARQNSASKSAADLITELSTNTDHAARMKQLERRHEENMANYREAADPILQDLSAVGCIVQTIGELRHTKKYYTLAIPILLRWLVRVQDRHVKEDIVRTLSVPWATEALRPLMSELENMDGAQNESLRWATANAIAILADDSVFDHLVKLVMDKKHGKAREMLVLAFGNCNDPRAVNLLLKLLDDETVVGHAVMALGKLKATSAKERIQELVKHPKKWVRRESVKSLKMIDKKH